MPVSLSAPQLLVMVLEQVTLALRTLEQNAIGDEGKELVGVLARLVLALKPPDQKTDGNGVNALPTPVGGGSDERG